MKILEKELIKISEYEDVKNGAHTYTDLMYLAGQKAFEIISEKFDIINKKIAVVCGNGNNGGDGFVIARKLYEHGAMVTVINAMGNPATAESKFCFEELAPIKTTNIFEDNYDIIIDAVFGIGLNRELDSQTVELFRKINDSNAIKISVDIPSGIEADTGKILGEAIKAQLTITFIALKPCFLLPPANAYCGEVIVADIGVTPVSYSYLTNEKPNFEPRKLNSHKGDFGTGLLICGSYGMAGAAILSAKSAIRSGIGIAKCVVCDKIYPILSGNVPEAVCVPSKQNQKGTLSSRIDIDNLLKKANAVLIGCGTGNNNDTKIILKKLLKKSEVPIVIDADGINSLCGNIKLLKKAKAPVILTPHSAEMARLCQVSAEEIENNRIAYSKNIAKEYGCTLILKGTNTIIAEPTGQITFNTNGNPGMATAGSGDVLAGIIVSLLSQGFSATASAKAAVFLHGEAGDKAAKLKGERAMIASDIIDML